MTKINPPARSADHSRADPSARPRGVPSVEHTSAAVSQAADIKDIPGRPVIRARAGKRHAGVLRLRPDLFEGSLLGEGELMECFKVRTGLAAGGGTADGHPGCPLVELEFAD
jgi:hypothetical protein